jgi:hypothetical protein
MTAACAVSADWDGSPPWCGEPAIGEFAGACIHEHISVPHRVCAADAAEIQRLDGTVICGPCERSAEPHDCPVTLTWTWYQ